MESIFLRILDMSITSCYVILLIIMARLLLKKAPKIFSYALWLVVLFRLVCPFSFESMYSLIPARTQAVTREIIYSQPLNTVNNAPLVNPITPKLVTSNPIIINPVNPIRGWVHLGSTLWLLGIGILLAYSIYTTIKLYLRLRSTKLIADNVYEVEDMKTPFVFGFIRPRIYLPASLLEGERAYIVRHEQTHIKRLDYLVKPIAFLVLCVHWFNPLAWVAFFLMSEDMELSCDESVIKQMGSNIKKDYSTSLLSLSTGKRIVSGCPLAFGENNTKGRIMNILNYRKPAFWVTILAVIAVGGLCIGLMSNPLGKSNTVEDYAENFVKEQSTVFEQNDLLDKVVDTKITKLEKVVTLDQLYTSPIEIWRLEYRLKFDDIEKVVFAGGIHVIDGWITEDTSMGKPMLVIAKGASGPEYLGCIWTADEDYSTLAGQELAARKFLQQAGLLPHETYTGNHILVKFPMSTGEISQLLMSQPVKQGEGGIWIVERWKDTIGNEYYPIPRAEGLELDYYKGLQEESDNGENPSLLDPLKVAVSFIQEDVGQPVQANQLEVKYDAMATDFAEAPGSEFIGYISEFSLDTPSFHLDDVEWLTNEDSDRLKELGIDPDSLDNGFYIYNKDSYPMYCEVNENTTYHIINLGETQPSAVSKKQFDEHLNKQSEITTPYHLMIKNGFVERISEVYLP